MNPKVVFERVQCIHKDLPASAKSRRPSPSPPQVFNAVVDDPKLINAVESLFTNGHHAEAVECAFKLLNNTVKKIARRVGIEKDGADLMRSAFSPKNPIIKINSGKTRSELDEQLGHMEILLGLANYLIGRVRKADRTEPQL